MIWQFDVPGTQTVTEANGWFSALFVGPALTENASTFDAAAVPVDGDVEPVLGADGVEPVSPHCFVDTCAISSRTPANIRRGTALPHHVRSDAGRHERRRVGDAGKRPRAPECLNDQAVVVNREAAP